MKKEFYIVGVGASAGGHDALHHFFSAIPRDVPAAFIIVTHLFRTHRSELVKIVSRFTPLEVVRISDRLEVRPGVVYVMPEDVELTIHNGLLRLGRRPPEHIINHTIDIFFSSLAEDQKEKAIGVILSGMGSDGSRGALKMFDMGAEVLVQDPSTTPFNSMPWSIIMKDHPNQILSPRELGAKITEMVSPKKIKVTR